MPRLGVFLSGSGRTLVNLARAVDRGDIDADIVFVLASRDCPGVDRARELHLPVRVVPGHLSPEQVDAIRRDHNLDLIALAGYLKMVGVSPTLSGRILNIHPSLLPAFGGPGMYGHRVHEAVLAAAARPGGPTESGCTVHIVDSAYDTGPIVAQARCPILPRDTPDVLAARVFALECELYPKAIAAVLAATSCRRA